MDATSSEVLWGQFGGAIDMLDNAIRACPDSLWGDRTPEFWYLAYHTLFFLDLYLHDAVDGFAPPAPFTLDELDPSGTMPDRVYSKSELLSYLQHGRHLARTRIAALNAETAIKRCRYGWNDVTHLGVAAVEHASRAAPCGAVEPAASTGDRFSSQVGGDEPIGAARQVATNGHKQTQRITPQGVRSFATLRKSGALVR